MTREQAESIFARFMIGEEVNKAELTEALLLAIRDMHKMIEIEEVMKK